MKSDGAGWLAYLELFIRVDVRVGILQTDDIPNVDLVRIFVVKEGAAVSFVVKRPSNCVLD